MMSGSRVAFQTFELPRLLRQIHTRMGGRRNLLEVQSCCAWIGNASQLRPLSHQHASQHCSLSHVFRVSSLSRLMLFDTLSVSCLGSDRVSTLRRLRPCLNIRIVSQIMSRLQATSRNQLCVTRIDIGDSWRNKMYIERAHILYSVELLDESHNSTYSLMRFSLYLLTKSYGRHSFPKGFWWDYANFC